MTKTAKQKLTQREYLLRTRHTRQAYIHSFKERPCADCGVQYPTGVMDFDHARGKKCFTIAEATNRGVSIARLNAEIQKCDVVCSNCHRLRTIARRSSKKDTPTLKHPEHSRKIIGGLL